MVDKVMVKSIENSDELLDGSRQVGGLDFALKYFYFTIQASAKLCYFFHVIFFSCYFFMLLFP